MIIDYDAKKVFNQSVQIDDPGNVALSCETTDGNYYFILTKAVMGKLNILSFGPVMPDLPELLDSYTCLFRQMPYNQKKVESELTKFINDPKKEIMSVMTMQLQDVYTFLPDIKIYWENL